MNTRGLVSFPPVSCKAEFMCVPAYLGEESKGNSCLIVTRKDSQTRISESIVVGLYAMGSIKEIAELFSCFILWTFK